MAIYLRFFNFIIPKLTLQAKFNGGVERFILTVPNRTFQEDEYLVSFGFMNEMDVEFYIKFLIKNGLSFVNGKSDDFVVTVSPFGMQWNVDWLILANEKAEFTIQ